MLQDCQISFTENLNVILIRQWQATLYIFSGIGVVLNILMDILDLSQDNIDWTPVMIGSVSMGFIVWTLIRNYLHDYVNLEKI